MHHNQLCACCGPRPYLSDMIPSDSESDFITTDSLHTEHLLRPVFMSCPTKIAKVITIPLSSLLIALCTVSLSAIPNIIQTINDRMSQGVGRHTTRDPPDSPHRHPATRKRTCFAPSLPQRATRLLYSRTCVHRERPKFLQLEYPHRTFTIELIESVHMNYYQLFRKVCLSSLPIRDLYVLK